MTAFGLRGVGRLLAAAAYCARGVLVRRWTDKRTVEGDGPYKCGGGRSNGGSKQPPYGWGGEFSDEWMKARRSMCSAEAIPGIDVMISQILVRAGKTLPGVNKTIGKNLAGAEKMTEFADVFAYDGDVMRI